MQAKTTVDEVSGRECWELPTLEGIDDNRTAALFLANNKPLTGL